ncbi:MAG: putative signal transducing protein [Candidatus Acidiferrales bacterium]
MEPRENSVRVWVGLDLLQAQMMKQMLLDSGIECSADRDLGVLPLGEFGEIGLWVSTADQARARELLEELEEQMSAELDTDSDEGTGS